MKHPADLAWQFPGALGAVSGAATVATVVNVGALGWLLMTASGLLFAWGALRARKARR